jgi:hypothetical protein
MEEEEEEETCGYGERLQMQTMPSNLLPWCPQQVERGQRECQMRCKKQEFLNARNESNEDNEHIK